MLTKFSVKHLIVSFSAVILLSWGIVGVSSSLISSAASVASIVNNPFLNQGNEGAGTESDPYRLGLNFLVTGTGFDEINAKNGTITVDLCGQTDYVAICDQSWTSNSFCFYITRNISNAYNFSPVSCSLSVKQNGNEIASLQNIFVATDQTVSSFPFEQSCAQLVTPTSTSTFSVTNSPTPLITFTSTPTNTLTASVTNTISLTSTVTSTGSATPSSTVTLTLTPTNVIANTVTPTATVTLTETVTSTPIFTPTITETATQSVTGTVTLTSTVTETPSITLTASVTSTASNTSTYTITSTSTSTGTSSATASMTTTITVTSTLTPTSTGSVTTTNTSSPTVSLTVTPTSTPTETCLAPTDSYERDNIEGFPEVVPDGTELGVHVSPLIVNATPQSRTFSCIDQDRDGVFYGADYVYFDGVAGNWYTVKTLNLGTNVDTRIELFMIDKIGSPGTIVSTGLISDDVSDSKASRIYFQAPQTTRYYIQVYSWNNLDSNPDTRYQLEVTTALAPTATATETFTVTSTFSVTATSTVTSTATQTATSTATSTVTTTPTATATITMTPFGQGDYSDLFSLPGGYASTLPVAFHDTLGVNNYNLQLGLDGDGVGQNPDLTSEFGVNNPQEDDGGLLVNGQNSSDDIVPVGFGRRTTIQAYFKQNCFVAPCQTQPNFLFTLWVDWNGDGVFDNSLNTPSNPLGEKITSIRYSTNAAPLNAWSTVYDFVSFPSAVTIPNCDQTAGCFRALRARLQPCFIGTNDPACNNPQPDGGVKGGEVEDYILSIQNLADTPTFTVTSTGTSTVTPTPTLTGTLTTTPTPSLTATASTTQTVITTGTFTVTGTPTFTPTITSTATITPYPADCFENNDSFYQAQVNGSYRSYMYIKSPRVFRTCDTCHTTIDNSNGDGAGNRADDDFYVFEILEAGTLRISLNGVVVNPVPQLLRMTIWKSQGIASYPMSPSTTFSVLFNADQTASFPITEPGLYAVQLIADQIDSVIITSDYCLDVTFDPVLLTATATSTATFTPTSTNSPTSTFTITATPTVTATVTETCLAPTDGYERDNIAGFPEVVPDGTEPGVHVSPLLVNATPQTRTFSCIDQDRDGVFYGADYAYFDGVAGNWYTVRTLNLGTNVDTRIELFMIDKIGNLGTIVSTGLINDDGNLPIDGKASRINFQAPQTTRYYVQIYTWNNLDSNPDTRYQLEVTNALAPTATATVTFTPSSTSTATATRTITETFTHTSTRTSTFTFTATNTATVTRTFTPSTTDTSTNTVTSTFTVTVSPTVTATPTETCLVHTDGYERDNVAGFPEVVPDGTEPGVHVSPLLVNATPQTRTFSCIDQDRDGVFYGADYAYFDGVAGNWYTVRTLNLGTNVDTRIELFMIDKIGNLGTIVSTGLINDDGNLPIDGKASRINFQAPQTTRYYVQIYTWNNLDSNPDTRYQLEVTNALAPTATATVTFTPSSTSTATATRTITETFTQTSTRTSTFTFTATNTATATRTVTPSSTATATRTATETFTQTFTRTPSFTATSTNTPTNTRTFTSTNTPSSTRTATSSFTATLTRTPTSTATSTFTITLTPTIVPGFDYSDFYQGSLAQAQPAWHEQVWWDQLQLGNRISFENRINNPREIAQNDGVVLFINNSTFVAPNASGDFVTPVAGGTSFSVLLLAKRFGVTVPTNDAVTATLWIDWNGTGEKNVLDSDEYSTALSVPVVLNQFSPLFTVTLPPNYIYGRPTLMRVRITDAGALAPDPAMGLTINGEVEDYQLRFTRP
ncbi:MAG: GEVED domain-containing protein [bacterium]